jgi:cytochrome c
MIRIPLALAAAIALCAGSAQAADAAKVFQLQCKTCHQAKSTPMGPSLNGVAGRRIASLSDFKYSPALTAKGGAWTDASLDAFLAAPGKFAPGNKMPAALPGAADRAAMVAYLATLK